MSQTPNYYWSKSTASFYPALLQSTYEASKSWPADAVPVEDSVFDAFGLTSAPDGQQRGVGSDGMPAWVTLAPPAST